MQKQRQRDSCVIPDRRRVTKKASCSPPFELLARGLVLMFSFSAFVFLLVCLRWKVYVGHDFLCVVFGVCLVIKGASEVFLHSPL